MSGTVVDHGAINKTRGSVTFANFPALNVTSNYLTRDGIVFNPSGNATEFLEVMTGRVTSQEVTVACEIVIHLVKSMSLAAAFQQQFLLNTNLGPATIRPDTPPNVGIQSWQLLNLAIVNVNEQSYAGTSADFPVRLGGYLVVNTSLFT